MKVLNTGYEFLVINGLTKEPITLKKGESVVFSNADLVYGHEQVFSTFDPAKLAFEKDVETEEKKAEKPAKAVKPVEEKVAEPEVTQPVAEEVTEEEKAPKATRKKADK